MTIRVHNLTKWRRLYEGETFWFVNPKQRVVVLEVNSEKEVRYFIDQDQEALENDPEKVADEEFGRDRPPVEARSFLGVVKGRERIEFAVEGAFGLSCEGGDAWIYSVDGVDTVTRIEVPEIFTRIADRRQRNPHLEMIEYQQRLNFERFKVQVKQEAEERVAALEKRLATYLPQRDQRAPDYKVGRVAAEARGAREDDDVSDVREDVVESEPAPAKKGKKSRASEETGS